MGFFSGQTNGVGFMFLDGQAMGFLFVHLCHWSAMLFLFVNLCHRLGRGKLVLDGFFL